MNIQVIVSGQNARDSMVKFNQQWLESMNRSQDVEDMEVMAIRWCLWWIGLREVRPVGQNISYTYEGFMESRDR